MLIVLCIIIIFATNTLDYHQIYRVWQNIKGF
jgi:hypothetical protein